MTRGRLPNFDERPGGLLVGNNKVCAVFVDYSSEPRVLVLAPIRNPGSIKRALDYGLKHNPAYEISNDALQCCLKALQNLTLAHVFRNDSVFKQCG